ncbi:PAS domain S-box protein [Tepidimonas taiwanensis]|uniref:Sensory/regulatory protein RpfC n=1 Tax=Tepidimonas taiwanensis TaxID=307486 RepID=A0A554X2T4_9BURK|nr:PAS domain S-box protein [Tepidimonas taiwanensis]TSE30161.1 Signal transduction histidine-protein kinase BarA [Tepidimonas taiwanensis]UBQ05527.1 PAS domain S-box protein [Tepidimonas taiwanensis]
MADARPTPPASPAATVERNGGVIALLVVVLVLALGVALGRWIDRQAQAALQAHLTQELDAASRRLQAAFDRYGNLLLGVRAWMHAQPDADWRAARAYAGPLELAERFPALTGFAYLRRLPADTVASWQAAQAQRPGAAVRVRPMRPGGPPTPDHYVIDWIEPSGQDHLVGLELSSDPIRWAAMRQAAQTGEVAVTAPVRLANTERTEYGLLFVLPLYRGGWTPASVAQRWEALEGFVVLGVPALELAREAALNEARYDWHWVDPEASRAAAASPPGQPLALDPPDALPGVALLDADGHDPTSPVAALLDSGARVVALGEAILGQRRYQLGVRSTPALEAQWHPVGAWIVGVGALPVALLAGWATLGVFRLRREQRERLALLQGDVQRLSLVARYTQNAIILTDRDGRVTWVNDACERITGYTADELIGQVPGRLLQCPRTDPQAVATLRAAVQAGRGCEVDILNRAKDGRDYWVNIELIPLRDEAERVTGFMAVEVDITERVRTQERLRAALAEAQALMDTINRHAIVSQAAPDGTIVDANEAFCAISGYTRDELIGAPHRIVNSGVHDAAFWRDFWTTIASGQPWRGEICNRAKDGTLYWVDSIVAPIFDAQGEIERYLSIRFDITPRKRAEAAQREAQQRLDNLLRATGAATWVLDPDTGDVETDARWWTMLGEAPCPRASVATWAERVHPGDLPTVQLALQALIDGVSETFEQTVRLRHRDGHWVWVRSRARAYERDASGRARAVYGNNLDISDIKNAEEAAARAERLLRSAIEAVDEGFVLYDPEDRLVYCNERYRQYYPIGAAVMEVGRTFEEIVRYGAERGEYAEAIGRVDEWVRERVALHRRANTSLVQHLGDGRVLRVIERRTPDGYIVGFRIDITELERARAAAQEKEQLLLNALEALGASLTVFDARERLQWANERFYQLHAGLRDVLQLGVGFETFIRTGLERGEIQLPPGTDAEAWLRERLADFRAGRTDRVVYRPDGQVLRVVERRLPNGSVVGLRFDVTELEAARRAAEEASRAKSQFVANMSHEIRTPMNAVLGMLQLLLGTPLDARQRDYAEKAEAAAKSLLGIINDILDFSKIEAGKLELDPEPFAVDRLWRDLATIYAANLRGKRIELLFDIDAHIPPVLIGDALRLQQVLINLGGNAIKFTSVGSVTLRVRQLQQWTGDDGQRRVRLAFAVIDTGIGIPPEAQARIFSGFTQAEASTTRKYGGTGLGLAISQRLVRMMGGEITLDSEVGRGSTFAFELDFPVASDVPAAWQADGVARELRGLRALVVEDHPMARDVLVEAVRQLGWAADAVPDAEAALRRVRETEQPYDVVFVDWSLPGMDGLTLAESLRHADSPASASALIMVTASGREVLNEVPTQRQSVLDGFLVKPVTAGMLLEAVMRARAEAQGAAAPQAPVAGARRLAGLRVLVVEDNAINQQVARDLLQREGATVTLAEHGQAAVDALKRAPDAWDVVLMDMQMPVLDGLQATRVIREQLGLRALPIIAMTANAMADDRAACLAAGMNDHVGKPFAIDQLVRVLQQWAGEALARVQPGGAADGAAQAAAGEAEPPHDAGKQAAVRADDRPWPDADRVDVPAALERLGGDPVLYARLARQFAQSLPHTRAQLDARLGQPADPELAALLHTLKGTAATVGAQRLADAAAQAERAVKAQLAAGDRALPPVPPWWPALADELAVTADALHRVLAELQARGWVPPAEEGAADAARADPARWRAELQRLQALLATSDMEALDVHDRLLADAAIAADARWAPLHQAMETMDFAAAQAACAALLATAEEGGGAA